MADISRKKRKKLYGTEIVSTLIILLFCTLILIPFWNALVISFESRAGFARHPFSWWPTEFNLENYKHLIRDGGRIIVAYKNTILLTVFGTLIGMIVSVMAAYAFSRNFPGKKLFFRLLVFTLFFGGGLVPTYMQVRNMGLLNTWTGIVLLSLCSTYNIIVMKNGFEAVPMDLQEAAMIDGATDIRIFRTVMLPLQKPLIATFSLFMAVYYWNSWYWQAIILNDEDKTVLQLYLRSIINSASLTNVQQSIAPGGNADEMYAEGIKMAAVFLVILPIMCVYPFLQKYFVKGVLVGAVKM